MRIKGKLKAENLIANDSKLAKEAHGWSPELFSIYSKMYLSWECDKKHIWRQSPANRYKLKLGCPYCSNNRCLSGYNDLQTLFPEIASEAYGWDPSKVLAGSSQSKAWKCAEGHTWNTQVRNRTGHKSNCRKCYNETPQKKRRNFPPLIETHPEIAKLITGKDISKLHAKSRVYVNFYCDKGHSYRIVLANKIKGAGCNVCSGQVLVSGINDLATQYPEVAKRAHGWDPSKKSSRTSNKLEWKCELGHIYESSSNQQIQHFLKKEKKDSGQTKSLFPGCPYCSGSKVLQNFNDLKSVFPDVAIEADGWDPTQVHCRSTKKYRWKCHVGHTWVTTPALRTYMESGCPSCAVSGFDPNKDAWLYLLKHEKWGLLQIGITNVPKKRLATHFSFGWTLIDLMGPLDGTLIKNWESAILSEVNLLKKGTTPAQIAGNFPGNTESWVTENLPINSLKELIELVRTSEWQE